MIDTRVFESGLGMMDRGLIADAWETMPLIQRAFPSRGDYVNHVIAQHEGLPTVQIAVRYHPMAGTQGGLVLLQQESPLVGTCLVIIHSYMGKSYRGNHRAQKELLKEALRVCRLNNIRWLVIPHMRDNGQQLIYKEVKHG